MYKERAKEIRERKEGGRGQEERKERKECVTRRARERDRERG